MPASPQDRRWIPELFANAIDGVSSAVAPEFILPTQLAWGINTINRGAKPGTRPPLKFLCSLPDGLVQGVSYFGVQGGMGVASVDGFIYRLRITPGSASVESISLPWGNSPIIKQVFMQQTVESLVIQDGQSNPIIYNGSVATRSDPATFGVPRGKQMAYGNGRLWVAINGNELVAGDIRTQTAGSELQFTETNYLSGGGKLFFPRGISGMAFIATTGTSDYGALLVFGSDYTESIRADITFRDLWAQMPGFVTNVLRHTGCISHWSIVEVNQDLYWRDASGGIRSIRSALADENGPGNAPISREVSRLTDYDSPQLLPFCSGISFNNRLLMLSSPRLNDRGGVTWRDIIPLDFAPISTMRGKSFPAYDGQWQGINFTHLFQGQFQGKSRAFAVSADDNGHNALWEIEHDGAGALADEYQLCTDGTGASLITPIQCVIEHGSRDFGNTALRKRLERCDVYLLDMEGEVDLQVYWRSDNNQKWQQWNEEPVTVCAQVSDPEDPDETVHVWKNLLPQQRPQIKTFTIPSEIDEITRYSLQNGFEFQLRLVWTGRVRIDKTVLYASPLDDTPFALREFVANQCLDNNVTGNEIIYRVPAASCGLTYSLEITLQPSDVHVVDLGTVTPTYRQVNGAATLCGFSEFLTTPSSPPKKYRVLNASGFSHSCLYYTENCPPEAIQTVQSVDRDSSTPSFYNALSCGFTSGQIPFQNISGSMIPCQFNLPGSPSFIANDQIAPGPPTEITATHINQRTLTTVTSTAIEGVCTKVFLIDQWVSLHGVAQQTLSDEDFESDAISRFETANPQGAFAPGVQNAFYEARTTGFSFAYGAAQFRIQGSGFDPGQTLSFEIPIYRHAYSGGSFALAFILSVEVNADGSGNVDFFQNVPNARGFVSYAGDATILTLA